MVRGILCAALVAFMGVAGSGLAMAQSSSASADPVADFYAGKTMTIIVGSEPGGCTIIGLRDQHAVCNSGIILDALGLLSSF